MSGKEKRKKQRGKVGGGLLIVVSGQPRMGRKRWAPSWQNLRGGDRVGRVWFGRKEK